MQRSNSTWVGLFPITAGLYKIEDQGLSSMKIPAGDLRDAEDDITVAGYMWHRTFL